jgi:TetR/AcrR family transcriptional repressor of lmrAB and yxaGH operons
MPAQASSPRSTSREAFVRAAAGLMRRQGYAATGLKEIVVASGAPRGSLYFHFPGGKEELAAEALTRAGSELERAMRALLAGHEQLGPALAALVDVLAAGLEHSDFADGCPVATVALETSASSEPVRAAAQAAFAAWLAVIEERMLEAGLAPQRARQRALLVLSAVEGALVLARAQRSTAPLLAVREELLELHAG